MTDDLQRYGERIQSERVAGPSASNVSGCGRRIAGEFLGWPETNPKSTHAADLGTLLHLGYSAVINSEYPDDSHSAPYRIEVPELNRTVEADHVDWDNRVVDDLKSAKAVIWQGWVNKGTPYEDMWDQPELYAFLLRRQHGGDWTLRLTAFNRETGERAVFERAADPEVGAALLNRQVRRLELLADSLVQVMGGNLEVDEAVRAYPQDGRGPGTGMPCDYCPFLDACWPPTGPDDPRSPQSASVDGDTAALAQFAEQYDEGRTLADKGKRLQEEARAFMVGLTGTFGDFNVGWSTPKPPEDVPDCDAMQALLVELGQEIPTRPGRKSSPRINVKRKAQ